MSDRSYRNLSGSSREVLLIFGESRTDMHAIATLAKGLRPDLPSPSPRLRPLILSRSADRRKRASVSEEVARLTQAELVARRSVRAVMVHRDLDKIETDDHIDSHHEDGSNASAVELRSSISKALEGKKVNVPAIAVVPAFETEAWWMLWPDAVAAHRPGWRRLPDRSGARVDRIVNAKEILKRSLRPSTGSHNVPDYSESDGPLIARKVVDLGLVDSPKGVSVAYLRFKNDVRAL
jgi:hypothetical protein